MLAGRLHFVFLAIAWCILAHVSLIAARRKHHRRRHRWKTVTLYDDCDDFVCNGVRQYCAYDRCYCPEADLYLPRHIFTRYLRAVWKGDWRRANYYLEWLPHSGGETTEYDDAPRDDQDEGVQGRKIQKMAKKGAMIANDAEDDMDPDEEEEEDAKDPLNDAENANTQDEMDDPDAEDADDDPDAQNEEDDDGNDGIAKWKPKIKKALKNQQISPNEMPNKQMASKKQTIAKKINALGGATIPKGPEKDMKAKKGSKKGNQEPDAVEAKLAAAVKKGNFHEAGKLHSLPDAVAAKRKKYDQTQLYSNPDENPDQIVQLWDQLAGTMAPYKWSNERGNWIRTDTGAPYYDAKNPSFQSDPRLPFMNSDQLLRYQVGANRSIDQLGGGGYIYEGSKGAVQGNMIPMAGNVLSPQEARINSPQIVNRPPASSSSSPTKLMVNGVPVDTGGASSGILTISSRPGPNGAPIITNTPTSYTGMPLSDNYLKGSAATPPAQAQHLQADPSASWNNAAPANTLANNAPSAAPAAPSDASNPPAGVADASNATGTSADQNASNQAAAGATSDPNAANINDAQAGDVVEDDAEEGEQSLKIIKKSSKRRKNASQNGCMFKNFAFDYKSIAIAAFLTALMLFNVPAA